MRPHIHYRHKATGEVIETTLAHFWRFRDGKAVQLVQGREKALESVRAEVSGIVLEVTEKVIGEVLDGKAHQKLIDQAIREVGVGGNR